RDDGAVSVAQDSTCGWPAASSAGWPTRPARPSRSDWFDCRLVPGEITSVLESAIEPAGLGWNLNAGRESAPHAAAPPGRGGAAAPSRWAGASERTIGGLNS